MKKITINILLAAAVLFLSGVKLSAQNSTEVLVVDTAANFSAAPLVDSTLVGADIFNLIDEVDTDNSVKINQSPEISAALKQQISKNSGRKITGYRVRIYFNNAQNARGQSQYVAQSFAGAYPHIRVYRSHVSPYFKVTVGDFRTKSEAQRFANEISGQYPSVFIVKEIINFPDV